MGRTMIRISVILCLQIGLALSQDPDGLFFFVRDGKAKCVAAGDAFSPSLYWLHNGFLSRQSYWNVQLPEELLNISSYVKYTTSASSCKYQDISKDYSRCKGDWELHSSDFSKTDFPVLDERWEGLPLEVTKRTSSEDGDDVRPPPHQLPTGSWTRGVSMLPPENSYIMLCDGEDPFSSNCYWLIINGWPGSGFMSALRYCPRWKSVPRTGYPTPPCKDPITDHRGWIGPTDDWLHLRLAWDHELGALKVSYLTAQSEELPFITHANTNIKHDISHIILRNEKDTKLWRINQNYGFKLSKGSGGFNTIRNWLSTLNTNCLLVNYSIHGLGTTSFTGQFILSQSGGEEKIVLQGSLHGKQSENLSGTLNINSFEDCKKADHVRLLDSDKYINAISCASLTQPPRRVRSRQPSAPGPKAQAMFQLCTKLYGDCDETLMCDETSCVCAPGYTGSQCKQKCQGRRHGFQCVLQCSDKCLGSCNHIDGKCEKCRDTFKYKLPFCNETYPYLKSPPVRVITGTQSQTLADTTTLKLKFNSEDINGSGQPKTYSPQWQEVVECNKYGSTWKSGDKSHLPPDGSDAEFTLSGLRASTTYQVRVLLFEDGSYDFYDQQDLPTACFKTSCIPDLSVVINPVKRSATVTVKQDHGHESRCSLEEYKWKLLASQGKPNPYILLRAFNNMGSIILYNLTPYTSYSLQLVIDSEELNYTNEYPFTTQEDAPSAPLSLTMTSVSDGQVILEWQRPEQTNGKLRNFHISCKVVNSTLLYQDPKPKDEHLDVTEDKDSYSMRVNGLSASTWYIVSVSGVTIAEGDSASILLRTAIAEPRFGSLENSVTSNFSTITLPPADENLAQRSCYFMIVKSESDIVENDTSLFYNLTIKEDVLKNANIPDLYPNAWIAAELKPSNTSTEWIVGDNTSICSIHVHSCLNRPLLPDNVYTLYVVLMNDDGYNQRFVSTGSLKFEFKMPGLKFKAPIHEGGGGSLYFLILLLVILPVIIWIVFRYYRKKPVFPGTNLLKERSPRRGGVGVDAPALLRPALPEPTVECQVEMTDTTPTSTPATTMKQQSCRVKIADLKDYIRTSVVTGELSHQFTMFPRGQTKPWDYGRLPQNKQKNRYGNLLAYDEHRVVLEKLPNEAFSDYINATYVDGYNVQRMYIASQGPKTLTMGDFWRMIWQEKVQVISMVTNLIENGKTKCDQYWPERGLSVTHGGVTITAGYVQVLADYTIRQFHVKKDEETRKLTQLHFTSWPDHGVPLYTQSVASYLKRLLATPRGSGPILVHCSAGVGRTGTIVVLDACLRMAAAEGAVDVLRLLQQTREQRANMVDNLEQYKLIHNVLEECLVTEPTAITCDSGFRTKIDKLREAGGMEKQFDRVMMNQPPCDVDMVEHRRMYGTKDRVPDVVPSKTGRIYLSRLPEPGAETSDYINAVSVDGFQCKNQFIATQFPLPTTVKDFWRLIAEQHVSFIIALHQVDESSKNVCKFWPVAGETLKPTKSFTVTLKSEVDEPSWISRTFSASVFNDSDVDNVVDEWQVKMLHLKAWPATELLPSDADPAALLIELWEETERMYRGKEPIVVCCLDGANACGLFVALAFVIEKVKLEQECDVCQAAHVVRYNRSQFIATQDQFEWLFEAAHTYLESFQTYANFQELQSKY